jgi:1-acyl-sn-glycerol-3-phosphate acyltransferase
MEEAALERYGFMKRIGIFGVATESRTGAARFLATSRAILEDPRRMLWVTAQGRFSDPRERPVRLRPGVAHLMARLPGAVALPLALEYPFWSEKRPEALAAFGPPIDGGEGGDARSWAARLERALEGTSDRLATLATARDPEGFTPVLAGRAGVGGVWGGWSRLRALARGERHAPDHMADRP